jgi:hypothetical protein
MPSYQEVLSQMCGVSDSRSQLYENLRRWMRETSPQEQRVALLALTRSSNYFQLRSILSSLNPLFASASVMDLPEIEELTEMWRSMPTDVSPHLLPTLLQCHHAARMMSDVLNDLHEAVPDIHADPKVRTFRPLMKRLSGDAPSADVLRDISGVANLMTRRYLYQARTNQQSVSYMLSAVRSVFRQHNNLHPLCARCTPLAGIMKGLMNAV